MPKSKSLDFNPPTGKQRMYTFRAGFRTLDQLGFIMTQRAKIDPDGGASISGSIVFAIGYCARQLGWRGSKYKEPGELLKSNRDFVDPAKSKRKKKSA